MIKLKQNSDSWKEARKFLLGASELPQAIVLSYDGSPTEFLRQKFGNKPGTRAMEYGKEHEAPAKVFMSKYSRYSVAT